MRKTKLPLYIVKLNTLSMRLRFEIRAESAKAAALKAIENLGALPAAVIDLQVQPA